MPHHFVGTLPLDAYYSAALFERDTMQLLPRLFSQSPYAILCGGSMMYVDAVTDGIDDLPDITPDIRTRVSNLHAAHGLPGLLALLENLDPDYAAIVDPANTKRIAHAIEITLAAGRPYSTLRLGNRKQRPFRILKYAIDMPRPILFDRINRRVDAMMAHGLLDEARRLYPLRHLNALNTVGYKELFACLDGQLNLPTATARIAKNTRVYAKKQLTWLSRPTVRPTTWLPADTPFLTLLHHLTAAKTQ